MTEEEHKQSRETFTVSRRKAVQLILSQLSDEDVLPEHKSAIALRQDLLFGFRMNLETYEECRDALHNNPSSGACIFCGTMIASFASNELIIGPLQINVCQGIFFQAAEELNRKSDFIEGFDASAEMEILAHLGNSVEAIGYVARQLHYQGLLE